MCTKMRSSTKALIIAPLTLPILLILFSSNKTSSIFDSELIVSIIISYLGMLALGVPYIKYLEKTKKLSIYNLVAGAIPLGAISGLLFIAIFMLFIKTDAQSYSDILWFVINPFVLFFSTIIGGISAGLIGFIYGTIRLRCKNT